MWVLQLKSHDGILSYLQDRTANPFCLVAIFNPVLVCPQVMMGIKFLAHFSIPLIRDETCCIDFVFYFINLETYRDVFCQDSEVRQESVRSWSGVGQELVRSWSGVSGVSGGSGVGQKSVRSPSGVRQESVSSLMITKFGELIWTALQIENWWSTPTKSS